MDTLPDPGFVKVKAHVKVGGKASEVELTVPVRPVRPLRMLPVLRVLTDTVVRAAECDAASRDEKISCYKGCGACCSQLVPLRRMEARRMAAMVERMPEPRRTEILERFAEARRRMSEAGLLEAVEQPGSREKGEWHDLALRYFRAGAACPFLEEGSCSIYAERPLVCREFLVTSDPRYCEDPGARLVERLPIDSVGGALRDLENEQEPGADPWVALIHALAWTAAHPDDTSVPVAGPELVGRLLEEMSNRPEKPSSVMS